MALSEVAQKERVKGGKGGLIGKIAGIGAAVAAAPFTGGQSLKFAPTAGAIGGAIGGAADPAKRVGGNKLALTKGGTPEVQLASLVDARKAAFGLPEDQANAVVPAFDKAIERLKKVQVV